MEDRKKDHINLAFESRIESSLVNSHFNYEPMLAAHPSKPIEPFSFAAKTMRLPVWISSMTGGTSLASKINTNLAMACNEFGLGMGLGSCRILLDDDKYFPDFDVRHIIGDQSPFYANIGIAQLESMVENKSTGKIDDLVARLKADGVIIHVNPLQEAFQPEGDLFKRPPIETIQQYLEETSVPVIVKEVGQGMGPDSIKAVLKLHIQAFEFGAMGGTNFTLLELSRNQQSNVSAFEPFSNIGHTAIEMAGIVNNIANKSENINCQQIIISGGITNVLEGYRLVKASQIPAVFGMGAAFLKHAAHSYESLQQYVRQIEKGIMLANSFLRIKQT